MFIFNSSTVINPDASYINIFFHPFLLNIELCTAGQQLSGVVVQQLMLSLYGTEQSFLKRQHMFTQLKNFLHFMVPKFSLPRS